METIKIKLLVSRKTITYEVINMKILSMLSIWQYSIIHILIRRENSEGALKLKWETIIIYIKYLLIIIFLILTGVRPDVLQQTVVLSQSVQRVVRFTSSSDVTGQSVSDVFTWDSSTFFINLSDVDLNGSVILGLDNAVSSRTLSWNV